MTPFFSEPVLRFASGNDYSTISTQVGVIAVILLMALLIERELLRTSYGPASEVRLRWMNAFIVPLLVAFAVIVGQRFLELLP